MFHERMISLDFQSQAPLGFSCTPASHTCSPRESSLLVFILKLPRDFASSFPLLRAQNGCSSKVSFRFASSTRTSHPHSPDQRIKDDDVCVPTSPWNRGWNPPRVTPSPFSNLFDFIFFYSFSYWQENVFKNKGCVWESLWRRTCDETSRTRDFPELLMVEMVLSCWWNHYIILSVIIEADYHISLRQINK